jgi:flagellar hook-length control protein FliK
LPVSPFLPIRPSSFCAPASASLPLYAVGFEEILAGRQQTVSPEVAPTISAETLVELAIAPATGETPLPAATSFPDRPLLESVALVPFPAPMPVRALPTPAQEDATVVDTETPPAPIPPNPAETIVSAIRPEPVVHAHKLSVSRDITAKTPTPAKTADVSRVLQLGTQAITITAQPMMKRDLPIARRVEYPNIASIAEGETAPAKPTVDVKSIWNTLTAQSRTLSEQEMARAQDTPTVVTFGPSLPTLEALGTTRPSMSAGDIGQIADRVLDVSRGNVWIDQLAADISAAQKSDGELNFRLIPARLGQLDVQISTREAGMALTFSAQNDEAANIVAAAQPRLVEELRSQGIRVAGSEVGTAPGQTGQNQNGGQNSQRQQPTQFFDQQAQGLVGNRKQAPSARDRFA